MESLPTVTTSDLSRTPRAVLDRIKRGERLIVLCHNKPVATLQPLDGFVFQPFTGTPHDVFGWPVGGIEAELAKLSEAQRMMLGEGVWHGRVAIPTAAYSVAPGGLTAELEDMGIRGLLRRTYRGWELTSRGLALREALVQATGVDTGEQGGSMLGFRNR